jgi:23S rRNA (cytosine1962-C5)-methyltransferase
VSAPNRQGAGSEPQTLWVKLRSAALTTFIYRRMVGEVSADAKPGDCVAVYDKHGALLGHGLYNPRSQITVRMLNFDGRPVDQAFWRLAIERAVTLRTRTLHLDEIATAYRLIHAEGDELSGLVLDRYDDVLSAEVFSLGMWQRVQELLPVIHEIVGTRHHIVQFDERAQAQEDCTAKTICSEALPEAASIREHGVRFKVHFRTGHKTGFFCDQRENRMRLAGLAKDADVLDLCCYTGAFGIYAKTLGGAKSVTGVDPDEEAVDLARQNANLNQVRVSFVHADAFGYMRQMLSNEKSFDVVVLDPPKLIFGRKDLGEGRGKYFDFNRLAAALVKPGGLMLTCSCSGALPRDDFVTLLAAAVRQADRQCQILDVTGPGADHPVSPRCPQSAYLKAAWLRIW